MVATVLFGAAVSALTPTAAQAAPESIIVSVQQQQGRRLTMTVHSAAMDTDIPVDIQRPADDSVPRPVLYLLQGAAGGIDGITWKTATDAFEFLADKNINVVSPIGGPFSYYADWIADDPRWGRQKWRTFLVEELPPLINEYLRTSGLDSIAGFSMSGTSSLALAATTGSRYRSVAAYSGCAQISDPIGQELLDITVGTWGLGKPENMYGPSTDQRWRDNDPYVQAEGLRGKSIYISSGGGLPGKYDVYDGRFSLPGPDGFAAQLTKGAIIEAATNYCSRNMRTRLTALGIPATYDIRADGTHSWGYWDEALRNSWPVLAAPLGI
ncbi:esterase family protein [Nocardia panacis]|uniref:Esterase family protein n=1 Tax=Nocardia panacis TaxID=2340916 RepID=A0A3A4JXZ8_9NOCA|nr:alpha/beta hydrolase family protein [Nocardia panacis]RJO72013.1 esterase family protein [Nocardia panacis]